MASLASLFVYTYLAKKPDSDSWAQYYKPTVIMKWSTKFHIQQYNYIWKSQYSSFVFTQNNVYMISSSLM